MPDEPTPLPTSQPTAVVAPTATAAVSAAEIEVIVDRLLAQKAGGDPKKLAHALVKQNVRLKADLEAAQKAVLPADRVAVTRAEANLLAEYRKVGDLEVLKEALTTLDAYKPLGPATELKSSLDVLKSYQALGKPDEVKAAVEALPQVRGELVRRDRDAELDGVATRAGYAPGVLKRLAGESLRFVPAKLKDARGQEVETFEVVDLAPDGKERTRSLADWEASDEVKELLPALKPAATPESRRDLLPIGGSGYRGPERRPGNRPTEEPLRRDASVDRSRRAAMTAASGI